jgi:hypothetical protein
MPFVKQNHHAQTHTPSLHFTTAGADQWNAGDQTGCFQTYLIETLRLTSELLRDVPAEALVFAAVAATALREPAQQQGFTLRNGFSAFLAKPQAQIVTQGGRVPPQGGDAVAGLAACKARIKQSIDRGAGFFNAGDKNACLVEWATCALQELAAVYPLARAQSSLFADAVYRAVQQPPDEGVWTIRTVFNQFCETSERELAGMGGDGGGGGLRTAPPPRPSPPVSPPLGAPSRQLGAPSNNGVVLPFGAIQPRGPVGGAPPPVPVSPSQRVSSTTFFNSTGSVNSSSVNSLLGHSDRSLNNSGVGRGSTMYDVHEPSVSPADSGGDAMRNKARQEIIDTELSYRDSLRLIRDGYVRRFKGYIKLQRPLLTVSQIDNIFSNISELEKLSSRLSKSLRGIQMQGEQGWNMCEYCTHKLLFCATVSSTRAHVSRSACNCEHLSGQGHARV